MVPRYDFFKKIIMKVSCIGMWKQQKLGTWYANYFRKIDMRKPDVFYEYKIYFKMIISLGGLVQYKLSSKESMPRGLNMREI